MENPDHETIIRYLEGTADTGEKAAFMTWLQADRANKELFFKLKAIYYAARQDASKVDIDKSWDRLLAKRRRLGRRVVWRRAVPYAAAVVVAAIAGWQLARTTAPDTEPVITARYESGDGIATNRVVLSDGTVVHLGAQTTFHCADDFGRSGREVWFEGEALFEVARNEELPFVVHNGKARVEVLGTTFNVSAFAADSMFVATLLEGAVRIDIPGTESVVLAPDQQYAYNLNSGRGVVSSVDTSRVTDWTRGYYSFESQSLSAILYRLGNIYGVNFVLDIPDAHTMKYTGTFYRGQTVREILDVINLSIPLRYTIDGGRITVSSSLTS